MNRILTSFAAALAALVGTAAQGSAVTDDLQAILASPDAQRPIPILVYLNDQVDLDALEAGLNRGRPSRQVRHETVVRALQDRATATQGDFIAHLEDLEAQGRVDNVHAFWIVNAFRLEADPATIEEIAARGDVASIFPDYPIELIAPINYDRNAKAEEGPSVGDAPENGVVAVRAPEVWATGITGAGVLVASLDTGVEGTHPAVGSRWEGTANPAYAGHPEWAWFDPVTNTTFPQAWGSHGTHTMGTVCGGAPGDEVGVAPGATWIHAGVIDRIDIPTTVSDAILSFEWMIDPDGNPGTIFDVPRVCSNSWGVTTGHGYPPCDTSFWSFLDACEAAGTVILFSAGNEGSSGLRRPSDRATDDYRTVAVAAVDGHTPGWPIAGFSSRGPTFCTPFGDPAIKPDISAPGVSVRSAVSGGGYSEFDGTSMASPHVNGVVALMLEACPDLTVDEVKQVLYDTAVDLGSPGEDNDYGWGMIDAYEAVQVAFSYCGPGPPRARDAAYDTAVDTPITITLIATDYDGDPGGPLTYLVTSLPAGANTLTDPGNDHDIAPGDLPYALVGNGNEVQYTPVGQYYGDDAFQFAADDGGPPPDGGVGDPATISILVKFGPPVITTDTLPDGYLAVPYAPLTLAADQGQPALTWSVIEDQYDEQGLGGSEFALAGTAQGWHADDGSWSYSLPFTFPFYEELYDHVNVCSNGFIDFASTSTTWSNSDAELIANVRIAPLWDDVMTNCGGSGDIYIDEGTPDQVTIRWDGLLYDFGCGGNQVNFSVTLFADGSMRFHYGSNNSGLSPTIGISAGDGQNYVLASYNNAGSLPDADSLLIYPPSPLPEGMSLDAAGVLEGTPTEHGTFEPRFRVIDALGRKDQKQFTLLVHAEGAPGDVTGDGSVDFDDLLAVLSLWGPCAACPEDIDGDGVVGFSDLLTVLSNWS